jgi:riboflavin synthase alpha subunit
MYSVSGVANATTYTTSSSYISACEIGDIVQYSGKCAIVTSVDKTKYQFTVSQTLSANALNSATVYVCSGVAFGDYSSIDGWFTNATNLASKAIGKKNKVMNTGGAIDT